MQGHVTLFLSVVILVSQAHSKQLVDVVGLGLASPVHLEQ